MAPKRASRPWSPAGDPASAAWRQTRRDRWIALAILPAAAWAVREAFPGGPLAIGALADSGALAELGFPALGWLPPYIVAILAGAAAWWAGSALGGVAWLISPAATAAFAHGRPEWLVGAPLALAAVRRAGEGDDRFAVVAGLGAGLALATRPSPWAGLLLLAAGVLLEVSSPRARIRLIRAIALTGAVAVIAALPVLGWPDASGAFPPLALTSMFLLATSARLPVVSALGLLALNAAG